MRFTAITVIWCSILAVGCAEPIPADNNYYTDRVSPIFEVGGCVRQTTGCHIGTDTGTAAGNLDLTSYDALMRRRDTLPAYGPYPLGLLLLKVGDDVNVSVETLDPPDPAFPDERFVDIRTDIRHTGGKGLLPGTTSHGLLRQWIDNGFRRTGEVVIETELDNTGECVTELGQDGSFDASAPPADEASYARFVDTVQPVLRDRCAGSGCHGAALADLHLTCGDTEEQRHWNYHISLQHLANPPENAELLRRPLASVRGGTFHGGGDTFPTPDDAGYQAILTWGQEIAARAPELIGESEITDGYRFFVNRVQPMLVRKGCMMLNCHSPVSIKLNLRGGSGGSFSSFARRTNYGMVRKLLAIEALDVRESRLVAKNLFPPDMGGRGIAHRGGSLFEDFGVDSATLEDCAGIDADAGDLNTVPSFCIVRRWHEIEREGAIARGDILDSSEQVRALVWVARPLGVGPVTDFDTYRPGADLMHADTTVDATGSLSTGAPMSLLGGCGLSPATADVRGPAVSWDGTRLAFAARTSASEPLRLYWMNEDGSGCERIPGIAAPLAEENGILTHDFDPAWSPDDRVVFASTRGNLDRDAYDYQGPTRTPASMAPNANLYVMDADGSVRQLTFLLNQELGATFMADGRVIFTAEKREDGFHQLALRRENLDGGDYHPLYANRPSLGFESAVELVQLSNQNFAFIASDFAFPDGAGMLAVGNRSIGPDHADRSLDIPGFVRGLSIPAPGVAGGLLGVYRSPAALPTPFLIVSCDQGASDMSTGAFDWDLCEMDYRTGAARRLLGEAGVAEVEAVAIYSRTPRRVLVSDGRGVDHPELVPGERDAVVHFNDFPMIASLMFENTRVGRAIDPRIGGFDVLEVTPPPTGATTFDDVADSVITDAFGPMFVAQRSLGNVSVFDDGSTQMRVPGGTPIRFRLTDSGGEPLTFPEGAPFEGTMIQREQEQYYFGERIQRSVPRRFFNAICGGCHGSISGRELDVAVDLDVVTGASINQARDSDPIDLYRLPRDRGPAVEH